jgi:hypothetical protein
MYLSCGQAQSFPYITLYNRYCQYGYVQCVCDRCTVPPGLLTISPTTRCPAHAHQEPTPAHARHSAKDARHMAISIFYRCPFFSSIH